MSSGEKANRASDGVCHPGSPVEAFGIPHPRYFRKRGCKLLKTNGGSAEKKAKRKQEAARIEKTRVRGGVSGGLREVCSR